MAVKQYIVFTLDDEKFAVDINSIASIGENTSITPLPNGPLFVEGLLNLRGDIIPVVNLKGRFQMNTKYSDDKRILISNYNGNLIGYLVDDASESLSVDDEFVKPAPEIIKRDDNEYLVGICTKNDDIILIVDLIKVFSENELQKIIKIKDL